MKHKSPVFLVVLPGYTLLATGVELTGSLCTMIDTHGQIRKYTFKVYLVNKPGNLLAELVIEAMGPASDDSAGVPVVDLRKLIDKR